MPQHRPISTLLVGLVSFVLVLTSCSLFGIGEDESSNPEFRPLDFSRFSQAPALLVGRWEWRKSTIYGPTEPSVKTPSTTGRTETLVFPSPPDSVRVYRSDTLAHHLSQEEFFDSARWGVHADTLATSTVFRDGPEQIYERVE